MTKPHELTHRFPLLVEALARLRARSCIIDGEAVVCGEDGIALFARRQPQAHYADFQTRDDPDLQSRSYVQRV